MIHKNKNNNNQGVFLELLVAAKKLKLSLIRQAQKWTKKKPRL